MTKHTKIILEEMCKRIGVKYEDMDFKKPHWFWNFAWTQEQEDDFKKWIVSYLIGSYEARQELMEHPNLKDCDKVADEFIMQYGWKVKE